MSMHADAPSHHHSYNAIQGVAFVALALATVMTGLKAYLYFQTGAASFLASLMDSAMDMALSGTTWLGVKWASRPADENHRYGHGKMEALIGFVQFLVVGAAALGLAWQAGARLATPLPLHPDFLEIGLTVLILISTAGLVVMQDRVARQTGSLAIKGDRAHYTSDLLGNAALVVLLLVNRYYPVLWLDPLFSLLIAVILLHSSGEIGRSAVNTLLDHESSDAVRLLLLKTAAGVVGVEGVHDLRAIEAGLHLHISLDIEVDGDLPLSEAHDISRRVEAELLKAAPGAEIMIHIDPKGEIEDSRHQTLEPHHFS